MSGLATITSTSIWDMLIMLSILKHSWTPESKLLFHATPPSIKIYGRSY